MASPKSSPSTTSRPSPGPRTRFQPPPQPDTPPEVVDPVWLVKALAVSFGAALFCAWLTACLLFYQGEWQLILHPVKTIDRTPADSGLAYEAVRFDAAETGQPRLTGWWVPAAAGSQYSGLTVLYLHDGSGSLSGTVDGIARLHRAGLNVFAIDYRGFGQSDAAGHPTEARMTEDAATGLNYLVSVRHVSARAVIPYGAGLGVSLAAGLAHSHPELPAVILENPDPDATATAVAVSSFAVCSCADAVPGALRDCRAVGDSDYAKAADCGGCGCCGYRREGAAMQRLFGLAASPSLKVTLVPEHYDADYQAALDRFLGQYFPAPVRELK